MGLSYVFMQPTFSFTNSYIYLFFVIDGSLIMMLPSRTRSTASVTICTLFFACTPLLGVLGDSLVRRFAPPSTQMQGVISKGKQVWGPKEFSVCTPYSEYPSQKLYPPWGVYFVNTCCSVRIRSMWDRIPYIHKDIFATEGNIDVAFSCFGKSKILHLRLIPQELTI